MSVLSFVDMKILWLAHRDPLNPKAGGAERIIEEIGRRLVASSNSVTIFAPRFKNSKIEEHLHGIRIVRSGGNLGSHLMLPTFLLKEHFDVVVSDLGHAVPWISPKLLRRKLVVHFLHLHRRSLPGQVSRVLAFAISSLERCYFLSYHNTRFVTISDSSLHDLTENLHINIKKCSVIRPGVNSEIFVETPKTKQPSMIYFGGMRDYKRPYESLYILSSLISKFPDITLTAVGDGPSKPMMMQLARDLGVSDRVNFTGRIDSKTLSKLVGSSWLNIHTSVTEGWGISIIEAASAGTPTVGYDVPGVSESIVMGLNGLKVRDGDRTALCEAAERVLGNPGPFCKTSLEVAREYSWDEAAKIWYEVLKMTAESSS